MATLRLRLPDSLHARLRDLARRERISINQLITLAVAEKTAALLVEEVLTPRARRGDRARFNAALSHIADAPPARRDALPEPPRTRRRQSRES